MIDQHKSIEVVKIHWFCNSSLLLGKKIRHKTTKIPVLRKLTHMQLQIKKLCLYNIQIQEFMMIHLTHPCPESFVLVVEVKHKRKSQHNRSHILTGEYLERYKKENCLCN